MQTFKNFGKIRELLKNWRTLKILREFLKNSRFIYDNLKKFLENFDKDSSINFKKFENFGKNSSITFCINSSKFEKILCEFDKFLNFEKILRTFFKKFFANLINSSNFEKFFENFAKIRGLLQKFNIKFIGKQQKLKKNFRNFLKN